MILRAKQNPETKKQTTNVLTAAAHTLVLNPPYLNRPRQAHWHEPVELGTVVVRQRDLARGGKFPGLTHAPLAPVQGGLVACRVTSCHAMSTKRAGKNVQQEERKKEHKNKYQNTPHLLRICLLIVQNELHPS